MKFKWVAPKDVKESDKFLMATPEEVDEPENGWDADTAQEIVRIDTEFEDNIVGIYIKKNNTEFGHLLKPDMKVLVGT